MTAGYAPAAGGRACSRSRQAWFDVARRMETIVSAGASRVTAGRYLQHLAESRSHAPIMRPMTGRWEFWIDRGGTFTDVVARRGDGTLVTHKLLSEDPKRYDDAAIAGIQAVLGIRDGEPIPA